MHDARCAMRDARCAMRDPRSAIRNPGLTIQKSEEQRGRKKRVGEKENRRMVGVFPFALGVTFTVLVGLSHVLEWCRNFSQRHVPLNLLVFPSEVWLAIVQLVFPLRLCGWDFFSSYLDDVESMAITNWLASYFAFLVRVYWRMSERDGPTSRMEARLVGFIVVKGLAYTLAAMVFGVFFCVSATVLPVHMAVQVAGTATVVPALTFKFWRYTHLRPVSLKYQFFPEVLVSMSCLMCMHTEPGLEFGPRFLVYAWTHDFVLAGMAVFVGESTTLEKKSGMVLVFEALTTLWIARWRFGHSVLVRYDAQAHHFVYHHDYSDTIRTELGPYVLRGLAELVFDAGNDAAIACLPPFETTRCMTDFLRSQPGTLSLLCRHAKTSGSWSVVHRHWQQCHKSVVMDVLWHAVALGDVVVTSRFVDDMKDREGTSYTGRLCSRMCLSATDPGTTEPFPVHQLQALTPFLKQWAKSATLCGKRQQHVQAVLEAIQWSPLRSAWCAAAVRGKVFCYTA